MVYANNHGIDAVKPVLLSVSLVRDIFPPPREYAVGVGRFLGYIFRESVLENVVSENLTQVEPDMK